jgi:DNA-binding transcriptional regulator YhcF (GntR family)
MNTTLTTAAAQLVSFTVNELAAAAEVSETTARKFVKAELEAGTIVVDAEAGRGKFAVVAAEPTGRKVYRKNPDAIRLVRTNRFSKAQLTVQSLDELAEKDPFGHRTLVEAALGADLTEFEDENKWVSVCITHGQYTGSDMILDAWWKATHPAFCKACKKDMPAEAIAEAKNLPSVRKAAKKAEREAAAA